MTPPLPNSSNQKPRDHSWFFPLLTLTSCPLPQNIEHPQHDCFFPIPLVIAITLLVPTSSLCWATNLYHPFSSSRCTWFFQNINHISKQSLIELSNHFSFTLFSLCLLLRFFSLISSNVVCLDVVFFIFILLRIHSPSQVQCLMSFIYFKIFLVIIS